MEWNLPGVIVCWALPRVGPLYEAVMTVFFLVRVLLPCEVLLRVLHSVNKTNFLKQAIFCGSLREVCVTFWWTTVIETTLKHMYPQLLVTLKHFCHNFTLLLN